MHGVKVRIALLCLVTLIGLWTAPIALAAEQPQPGGILQVALAGDPPSLAKSWTVSDDHLSYTFTLHEGVKFHDGNELTSADVKAPDPYTVVIRLHYPSASFLGMLAHPANFIFAKKYLDQDVHYYKAQEVGTGPFKLKNYVRGASRWNSAASRPPLRRAIPVLSDHCAVLSHDG
jgi:ABC-type oligopeptide transport system substrate-binding subunit